MESNSPFSFSNWLPGEPNNVAGNENCMEINWHGRWNDEGCTANRHYICEMEAEYVFININYFLL